jgi:hypothetical protein
MDEQVPTNDECRYLAGIRDAAAVCGSQSHRHFGPLTHANSYVEGRSLGFSM